MSDEGFAGLAGARRSIRAFSARPVEKNMVEALLQIAARAPSGGNLQPWRVDVLAGPALAELKAAAAAWAVEHGLDATSEFPIYPSPLREPWRSRRFRVGEQLYAAINIPHEDRIARLRQFARNYQMFDAPVGLFFSIPRAFGPPQWAHLGMFMQTLMLAATDRGLGTCALEAWARAHELVSPRLGLEPDWMLYCGMALGWPDEAAPINGFRSERAPVPDFAHFQGF